LEVSYSVEFEPQAIADLEQMAASVRERILRKINWLAINFDQITPEPLKGNLSDFYKLRIGDYRAMYDLDSSNRIIVIVRVGHRREIYDL
jgi:mRNA interferase RelE/StbE